MSPTATPTRSRALTRASPRTSRTVPESPVPPIMAAVDHSAASPAAVETAVRLGADLGAPVLFVYVRRGPAGFLGAPVYQRRLTKAMDRARRVLEPALAVAATAGISAEAEILEGSARK